MSYLICIDNRGYEASLELRKLYPAIADPAAERIGQVRVVDESGEDYLFPKSFFVGIDLPASIEAQIAKVA